jgi:hypothetical protein
MCYAADTKSKGDSMTASALPPPPDLATRRRMVAEADFEMNNDPAVTEHYRQVHQILVRETLAGHLVRNSVTGRWSLTTTGAKRASRFC